MSAAKLFYSSHLAHTTYPTYLLGHAASWCAGYPEICPSATCLQPLNPASNLTFPLITSLLGECTGADSAAVKGELRLLLRCCVYCALGVL